MDRGCFNSLSMMTRFSLHTPLIKQKKFSKKMIILLIFSAFVGIAVDYMTKHASLNTWRLSQHSIANAHLGTKGKNHTTPYQWQVAWQHKSLTQNKPIGIDIRHHFSINKGVAWGVFSKSSFMTPRMLCIFSIFGLLVLAWAVLPISPAGYALIFSGAAGNIIDRFIHQGVIDFISVTFFYGHAAWSFPTFNVADILITCGALFTIAQELKNAQKRKHL